MKACTILGFPSWGLMLQFPWFTVVSLMKRFLMWLWLLKKKKTKTEISSKKTKNKRSNKFKSKTSKLPRDCMIWPKKMLIKLKFNQSKKNLPKTNKEKKKSKHKTFNRNLSIYPPKKKNMYSVPIIWVLIKKFPKLKGNSLSILPSISRNHGKKKNINFCTKMYNHKLPTKSNSLMYQLMT